MKRPFKIRFLAALLLASCSVLFLGGCSSSSERETSQLPWARPASWEGGMPGGFGQEGRSNAF